AMIGMGESDTENRAIESVEKSLNNPLLDVDIEGAQGALINVTGGEDITIKECQEIVETVSSKINADAKIIWGAQVIKEMGDNVRSLLIITGVKSNQIYGPGRLYTDEKKREVEKILGVDFLT
ncbi:MAG: cell division protein FtsZ, partial [Candidatus Aenigmarchaeota archaeon]|nr:cell division protein FtsZ [Candidatus Aenigmarchaeota archaeon]